jgi:hypothetical protein
MEKRPHACDEKYYNNDTLYEYAVDLNKHIDYLEGKEKEKDSYINELEWSLAKDGESLTLMNKELEYYKTR